MNSIVRLALEEDIGSGDITSQACIPESQMASGRFLAREPLIVAGLGLLDEIYATPVTLLKRERVALNFLQRLSGVATAARRFADAVAGTKCRVLDTRKTTPGLRALEKQARSEERRVG